MRKGLESVYHKWKLFLDFNTFYCPPINVTDNLIGNQDNPDTQAALDIRQRTKTNKTKTTTHKTKKMSNKDPIKNGAELRCLRR